MILVQFSAGNGPDECALAVAHAVARFVDGARAAGVPVETLEREAGPRPGTWRSWLLALDGPVAPALARRWQGTVRWSCPSPYRPNHGRKNWFVGVEAFEPPPENPPWLAQVRFEPVKASGAGGQHVNRTLSAVRATHAPTGLSVKAQTERSQHANKRLALALLARKLAERQHAAAAQARTARRQAHHELERGNPVRSFRGPGFDEVPSPA